MTGNDLFYTIFNLSGKNPFLDTLMIIGAQDIIFFSALLAGLLGLFGDTKEKKALLLSIAAFIVSIVLIKIIHLLYLEPRPFISLPIHNLITEGNTAAFPSRHTTTMAVIAFSYLLYRSKFFPIFIILMLWVGFARIYVGVHYPIDIVGGIFAGFLSVYLASFFKNWLVRKFL